MFVVAAIVNVTPSLLCPLLVAAGGMQPLRQLTRRRRLRGGGMCHCRSRHCAAISTVAHSLYLPDVDPKNARRHVRRHRHHQRHNIPPLCHWSQDRYGMSCSSHLVSSLLSSTCPCEQMTMQSHPSSLTARQATRAHPIRRVLFPLSPWRDPGWRCVVVVVVVILFVVAVIIVGVILSFPRQ